MGFYPASLTETNPGLMTVTGGTPLSSALIASAQAEGFPGIFLDPRYVTPIEDPPLVYNGDTNFAIESAMSGSIGYSGEIFEPGGYIDTGSSADGIQVYATSSTATAGIVFRNVAFVGQNSNAMIHFGGRQRGCTMQNCFALNKLGFSATFAGTTGTELSSFTGSQSLPVSALPSGVTSGTVIVSTTNASLPGLGLLTFDGVTAGSPPTLDNVTLAQGVGAATLTETTSLVQLIAAAVIVDTALGSSSPNSEDHLFDNCFFASSGGGIVVGIDVDTPTQNANDMSWNRITTACPGGLCSVAIFSGGGHNFRNTYDRTAIGSTLVATYWNDGGTLVCRGGEHINNNTSLPGVAHLVDASAARTIIDNMNVDLPTDGTQVMTITDGAVVCRGVTRIQGTVNLSGGILDLGDCAGQFGSASACSVSGSSGTLVVANSYPSGSAPTVTDWSGTTSTGPM